MSGRRSQQGLLELQQGLERLAKMAPLRQAKMGVCRRVWESRTVLLGWDFTRQTKEGKEGC